MNRKSFFKALGLGVFAAAVGKDVKSEPTKLPTKRSIPLMNLTYSQRMAITSCHAGTVVNQIYSVGDSKAGIYLFNGENWVNLIS